MKSSIIYPFLCILVNIASSSITTTLNNNNNMMMMIDTLLITLKKGFNNSKKYISDSCLKIYLECSIIHPLYEEVYIIIIILYLNRIK